MIQGALCLACRHVGRGQGAAVLVPLAEPMCPSGGASVGPGLGWRQGAGWWIINHQVMFKPLGGGVPFEFYHVPSTEIVTCSLSIFLTRVLKQVY